MDYTFSSLNLSSFRCIRREKNIEQNVKVEGLSKRLISYLTITAQILNFIDIGAGRKESLLYNARFFFLHLIYSLLIFQVTLN